MAGQRVVRSSAIPPTTDDMDNESKRCVDGENVEHGEAGAQREHRQRERDHLTRRQDVIPRLTVRPWHVACVRHDALAVTGGGVV